MSEASDVGEATESSATRRDVLFIATGAFVTIGTGAFIWPFVSSMLPSADVLAAGEPVTIDVSQLQPGQQISVTWQGKPIFILHRTEQALTELKNKDLLARLSDPDSQVLQQPGYARNWSRSSRPEFLVIVAICTHLGCIPYVKEQPGDTTIDASWPGGYFCPCHGSKYDLAGRVFRGVPAPYNLPVPPYRFVDDKTLVVGENPPGENFSLSSVVQL
ncbi:ubiquinol-cytochrome c reductase iron-sulfur subunit [Microvirga terricola]|uniref:Ubiquinol-cytochrome c reductase iron-sulfur subunit n=1 Tax=Microvirga terricola TaxID=2719797 RepID=A0ABX0V8W9_9HYPH|nr:ubiquinol-cytochrome c reductase iron-sulfur subunit [Microvirga terricola]NIX76168.1 ubiquinol-cytochrome c reductase iron-sulfur subunit [Microvirga terricola]